jgi:hypothetical protein
MYSKVFRLLLLVGILGSSSAGRAAPDACAESVFNKFVAGAQSLNKAELADGRSLIHCPQWQDQAVQWQAFLIALTGDVASSHQIDGSGVMSPGQDRLLMRAKAGYFRELRQKIDDQDSRYATSPDAQLILARVLTRKGQFARGREAYELYMRLRPDDDAAAIEYLYSWIWQGDLATASAQFTAGAHWSANPGFVAAHGRGQALIAKLGGAEHNEARKSAELAAEQGVLQTDVSVARIADVYLRRTASINYTGRFDLRLAVHDVEDMALTNTAAMGSEVVIGSHYFHGSGFKMFGHAGYFTLGDDHVFGDGTIELPIGLGITLDAGGYRMPMALLVPLTPEIIGLMRDGIFLGAHFGRYVSLRAELQKEPDSTPHELDTFLGQWPLSEGVSDSLTLRLPVSFESHPQPSPYYDTDALTVLAGLGIGWQRLFTNSWRVNIVADYNLAWVTDRQAQAQTSQTGLLRANANASVPLNELLSLTMTARLAAAQDPNYVRRHNELTSLLLGLSYIDPR